MKFKLIMTCDNSAFHLEDDTHAPHTEIARILRETADKLEHQGRDSIGLMDLNGSKVGTAKIIKEGHDE